MDSLTSSVLKYFQSSKENDALSLILYNQISIIIVGGGGVRVLHIVVLKWVSSF